MTEQENSITLLLLKIIKFNGDISPLVKIGYEYSQVISLIANEVEAGNAEYKSGNIYLTKKGNELISKLAQGRSGGSSTWIEPEIASRIAQIDKDFVYLPSKKELSF